MAARADDFTLVQRKKRSKGRTFSSNGRNLKEERRAESGPDSSKELKDVDVAALRKKILHVKDDLAISNFYEDFKDLLSKVLSNLRRDVDTTNCSSDQDCYDIQATESRNTVVSKLSDGYDDDSKHPTQSSHKSKSQDFHLEDLASKTCNLILHGERFGILKDSSKSENIKEECTGTSQHRDDLGLNKSEEVNFEVIDGTKVEGQFSVEVDNQSVETVVCYGLGNFSDCIIARYQLALLILICGFLKITTACCHVYDPRFTEEEKQILLNLGFNVIQQNEECKRAASGTTLFYMPHCGKPLYNNLLWANWSTQRLSSIVIIGNSFQNIQERIPSRLLKDFYFLNNITPFTREFPVKNKLQFDDIFNDTSIHIFPVERLLEIPSPLWENCKEPKYDPDLQLEIILRD
ncbi:uncharacterized protein LOC117290253 [Asterias rubens]|uniref:uncharacterized protein LOC117290253 n=1 Tax=Asterias rubens TaxID=7604 RepID=UPI001454F9F8|nr:uncharacterized protein LOC117290253 [Asterias rubens]